MFKRILILCTPVLLLPSVALAQASAATTTSALQVKANPAMAVVGVWTTPNDKSRVRISRTPEGVYKGQIIWLKDLSGELQKQIACRKAQGRSAQSSQEPAFAPGVGHGNIERIPIFTIESRLAQGQVLRSRRGQDVHLPHVAQESRYIDGAGVCVVFPQDSGMASLCATGAGNHCCFSRDRALV